MAAKSALPVIVAFLGQNDFVYEPTAEGIEAGRVEVRVRLQPWLQHRERLVGKPRCREAFTQERDGPGGCVPVAVRATTWPVCVRWN